MQTKKDIGCSFSDAWKRIEKETNIKTYVQLAEIVETSRTYVSRAKKEGNFPIKWAFIVAQKYNLFTDWIITGEGPKSVAECYASGENILTGYIAEWVKEQTQKDASFSQNFQTDCALAFPEFAEWLKKRKTFMAEGRDPRQNTA